VSQGSSGIIPITVDNSEGSNAIRVRTTVSKSEMDEELQKRIYFYADTAKTYEFPVDSEETVAGENSESSENSKSSDNSETVSRVYIGETDDDNYIYKVEAGQKLTLIEDYYNDVPIKWQWVYDLEGYYFRGSVTTETTDGTTPGATVEEYIRPIEYDYDSAVFDRNETVQTEDGEFTANRNYHQLLSIGATTLEDFLKSLHYLTATQESLILQTVNTNRKLR
jgi:hypothetical protein